MEHLNGGHVTEPANTTQYYVKKYIFGLLLSIHFDIKLVYLIVL